MPVQTINLNDFLVQKNSGDVVTGDDWNKLVALFTAVNGNALELLELIKHVDTNTANIAHVTQGSVPDGSINYDKLSKLGGTTKVYTITSDSIPMAEVTYYTLEGTAYTPHVGLTAFEHGVQYYTLETVDTEPAIAHNNVLGNKVIKDHNIAPKTLLPRACSDLLLGGLLNDNATVYTDKKISGTLAEKAVGFSVTHTIKLDKQHKAVVIIGSNSIIVLTADNNKPDLYIGGELSRVQNSVALTNMYTRHLVGDSKRNSAPQSTFKPFWETAKDFANYPSGLVETNFVQLYRCYYDYDTNTIHLTVCKVEDEDTNYSFGNLIIGL